MKPLSEPQPLCHRCKKPMTLHAVEVVEENGQKNGASTTMEVFHCDVCGQFSAREHTAQAVA